MFDDTEEGLSYKEEDDIEMSEALKGSLITS